MSWNFIRPLWYGTSLRSQARREQLANLCRLKTSTIWSPYGAATMTDDSDIDRAVEADDYR